MINDNGCDNVLVVGSCAMQVVDQLVKDICPGFYSMGNDKDDLLETRSVGQYKFLIVDKKHDFSKDPDKQAKQIKAVEYADMVVVAIPGFKNTEPIKEIEMWACIFKPKMMILIAADGSKQSGDPWKLELPASMIITCSTVMSFDHAIRITNEQYWNERWDTLKSVKDDWIHFLETELMMDNLCMAIDKKTRESAEAKHVFYWLNDQIKQSKLRSAHYYIKCNFYEQTWGFIRRSFEKLEAALAANREAYKGCFKKVLERGDAMVQAMPSVFPDGYQDKFADCNLTTTTDLTIRHE